MLELICNNAFVLFQVVSSGNTHQGIQVTQGRRKKKGGSAAKRPEFYWFERQDEQALFLCAARLIRAKLDKKFNRPPRPEIQLDLFDNLNPEPGLFDEPEPAQEHPLLTRAYDKARTLPSNIKWKPVKLGSAMACHFCERAPSEQAIWYMATVSTPAGTVLHLQCAECFNARPRAGATQTSAPIFDLSSRPKALTAMEFGAA
jgi:hypothetical protein